MALDGDDLEAHIALVEVLTRVADELVGAPLRHMRVEQHGGALRLVGERLHADERDIDVGRSRGLITDPGRDSPP